MSREIKFKAKRVFDGAFVYGGYLANSKGIIDEGNSFHLVHINTLKQFTGLVDADGKDIYSGDTLYSNHEKETSFSYSWDQERLKYVITDVTPNTLSLILNRREDKILNFSLVKKEMTKKQFIDKFFNNSYYPIADECTFFRLQAVALSLGFKSFSGEIIYTDFFLPTHIEICPPDNFRDYKYFRRWEGTGSKCDFSDMFKQYLRLY